MTVYLHKFRPEAAEASSLQQIPLIHQGRVRWGGWDYRLVRVTCIKRSIFRRVKVRHHGQQSQ